MSTDLRVLPLPIWGRSLASQLLDVGGDERSNETAGRCTTAFARLSRALQRDFQEGLRRALSLDFNLPDVGGNL
jgi:hypothetical protein